MFNYKKIKYFVLIVLGSISFNSFADDYKECHKNVYVIAIDVPYTSNVTIPDDTWGVYYSEAPDGSNMKELQAGSNLTTNAGQQLIKLLEAARILVQPVTFYAGGSDCNYFAGAIVSNIPMP